MIIAEIVAGIAMGIVAGYLMKFIAHCNNTVKAIVCLLVVTGIVVFSITVDFP